MTSNHLMGVCRVCSQATYHVDVGDPSRFLCGACGGEHPRLRATPNATWASAAAWGACTCCKEETLCKDSLDETAPLCARHGGEPPKGMGHVRGDCSDCGSPTWWVDESDPQLFLCKACGGTSPDAILASLRKHMTPAGVGQAVLEHFVKLAQEGQPPPLSALAKTWWNE